MKAIIYSRVSTEEQDNARQIEELKEYGKYRKFNILKIFQEKVTGASKAADRLEFKKLLAFIDRERIDHLLVWELSRLGRSMMDVLNTIEELAAKGVNIYIKKENMNTLDEKGRKSTMTTMLISILSGFAEMERETIKQRSISGIRNSVANGGSGTGLVMAYGYKSENKKLVVDDEEAKVIKLIFEKYLSGLGTMQIAKYLNSEGIKTRYNKVYAEKELKQKHGILKKGTDYNWKDGTIYRILTNTIYIGERRHKGEIFPITPIIDKDTFNRVQKRLADNYNKKDNNRRYPNPLSDLLICGKCGRSYFMHKRADNRDNAYKCLSKRYSEYCGNPSVNIDKLLKALFYVCQPIIHSDAAQGKAKHQSSIVETLKNKQIELSNSEKESLEISKQLDNLVKLNLAGQITIKQFASFKSDLNQKLEKIDEKIATQNKEVSELQKLANLGSPSIKQYSREIFDTYLKDAVEYVKIYECDSRKVKEIYTSLQDVPILVEVKSSLIWANGDDVRYFFTISRRSNILGYIKTSGEISKGKYFLEDWQELDEIDATKILNPKNLFLIAKNSTASIPLNFRAEFALQKISKKIRGKNIGV